MNEVLLLLAVQAEASARVMTKISIDEYGLHCYQTGSET